MALLTTSRRTGSVDLCIREVREMRKKVTILLPPNDSASWGPSMMRQRTNTRTCCVLPPATGAVASTFLASKIRSAAFTLIMYWWIPGAALSFCHSFERRFHAGAVDCRALPVDCIEVAWYRSYALSGFEDQKALECWISLHAGGQRTTSRIEFVAHSFGAPGLPTQTADAPPAWSHFVHH